MKENHKVKLGEINKELHRLSREFARVEDLKLKREKLEEIISLYEQKRNIKRLNFVDKMNLKIFKKLLKNMGSEEELNKFRNDINKKHKRLT